MNAGEMVLGRQLDLPSSRVAGALGAARYPGSDPAPRARAALAGSSGGHMYQVIFIGDLRDAEAFRNAGIASYAPPRGLLAERVLAERRRCRVLAMTETTLAALPAPLARELREGGAARITIVPELNGESDRTRLREMLRQSLARTSATRG